MNTKITILAFSIIVLITSISCSNPKKEIKNVAQKETVTLQENSSEAKKDAKLKSSLVCFVNNKFMGIDQIPVEVEGKTYYGCCPDCVGKIKTLREVRYATDPLTGAEVDKALAYIVMAPQGNNDILYFESEQTYIDYIKQ
ncbi:MAG: hypothetical protein ACOH1N_07740 [Lutibacter sp.]